jgi:hypothetical protein
MKFVPIHEIYHVWKDVRKGLWVIKDKCKEKWIPEDIYHSLMLQQSQLYLLEDGFVIIYPRKSWDGNELYIWCAYCPEGEAVEKYEPYLMEMARNINARRLVFESPRNWRGHGYIPIASIYVKDVQ